jgi:hypothetical protein
MMGPPFAIRSLGLERPAAPPWGMVLLLMNFYAAKMKNKYLALLLIILGIFSGTIAKGDPTADQFGISEDKQGMQREADFLLTKEGFLTVENKTEEEGVKLKTVAASVPAVIKEDLIETKRKNRLITYYIQGELKIIESYNQDGENEQLKTLFVSTSQGHKFRIVLRDGVFVLADAPLPESKPSATPAQNPQGETSRRGSG